MAVPRQAVTEHDIHVNFIEKLSTFSEWFASWGIRNGGEVTDGGWEFTCFNQFGIEGGRSNVFLVAKAAATKDAVQF
eukprot:CCRYP_013236-RA/>CCRYP_013236-RA protein AED:0.33 eAED:0.33 QI:39/1/1/1/0/0/2/153/76